MKHGFDKSFGDEPENTSEVLTGDGAQGIEEGVTLHTTEHFNCRGKSHTTGFYPTRLFARACRFWPVEST